jgi:hypothetical protein
VPWAAGREEEQTVDDVQPGKIADRIGHSRGSDVEVAPGTGGISLSIQGLAGAGPSG